MADRAEDWSDWLDRCGAALLLLARQFTRDRADAEDAVQEGFVRFWNRRASAADPAAYLFACVRSAALDQRRSDGRRTRRERSAAVPEPIFAEPDADRAAAVEAALAGLPIEQREVLVLRIWGGLSFPQIGEALGIPSNTAASRHRYALTALRRTLGEEEPP